jgi:hypothetical protein
MNSARPFFSTTFAGAAVGLIVASLPQPTLAQTRIEVYRTRPKCMSGPAALGEKSSSFDIS